MKSTLFAVALLLIPAAMHAGKFQHFKVSTYIRAQDVARMDDDKFLKSTWESVSTQVEVMPSTS